MDNTVVSTGTEGKTWGGGSQPLKSSYGKMMMWFFIVSDALTFSGFLAAYGFSRFKFIDAWPIADEVFTHIPFYHEPAPMIYVAFMTFVLIMSSVTMVLAVDAGHHMQKDKVTFYMALTIIGGAIFVGSQAWEWKNFIKGEYGALETRGGQILQFVNAETGKRAAIQEFAQGIASERATHQSYNGIWYEDEKAMPNVSLAEVKKGFLADPNLVIRTQQLTQEGHKTVLSREASLAKIDEAVEVVEGAKRIKNWSFQF